MYTLSEIINGQSKETHDDIKVIKSTVQYKEGSDSMEYILLEMEMRDNLNRKVHIFKAIKFYRLIKLPDTMKQSTKMMDIHAQLLSAFYESDVKFINILARIEKTGTDSPIGLLQLYGVQGVGKTIEEAKRIADQDFSGLTAAIQGSYRTLEFRYLNSKEAEWLREKMANMKHIQVVRGIPSARKSSAERSGKGLGGTDLDPGSEETSEQFAVGLANHEFIVMTLSSPIEYQVLENWLSKTSKKQTYWNSIMQGSTSLSAGINIPIMFSANLGSSLGMSDGVSDSVSEGNSTSHSFSEGSSYSTSESVSQSSSFSESIGTSQSIGMSQGESFGSGQSVGTSAGIGHSEGVSVNEGIGQSTGTSIGQSASTSHGTSTSQGTSNSFGFSQSNSMGSSVTNSAGVSNSQSESFGNSNSFGTSNSNSSSVGNSYGGSSSTSSGISSSVGHSSGASSNLGATFGISAGAGTSESNSNSIGTSVGSSSGNSWGNSSSSGVSSGVSSSQGSSNSNSFGTTTSQSQSTGQSISQGTSTSQGSSTSQGFGESFGSSSGQSFGSSSSNSQSFSKGQSIGDSWSQGVSEGSSKSYGQSLGTSTSQGVSQSQSQGTSSGYSQGVSKGTSSSESWGEGTSNGRSQGVSSSISNSTSQGMGASMGVGASLGIGKSYQFIDAEVVNIVELLEFQKNRLKMSIMGKLGAFFVDMYIATENEEAKAAARTAAKASWGDEQAMTCPLQILEPEGEENEHLLYHMNAFSPCAKKEKDRTGELEGYKYTTILTSGELTAYTHIIRLSDGGLFADIQNIPELAVPSEMSGEIYLGKIISGYRWTLENGYKTPFDYRVANDNIMHGLFAAGSRSGKTVAALRFVAELANNVKRKPYNKRMRIIALDPKEDWRKLAKFVEPERFRLYSMGDPDFFPFKLNPLKVPYGVDPEFHLDTLIDVFCRSYGLGVRSVIILLDALKSLYEREGVFDTNNPKEISERSSRVTIAEAYNYLNQKKENKEFGRDKSDAVDKVLDRLGRFAWKNGVLYKLYCQTDGMSIDELLGQDDVVVLESGKIQSNNMAFIFGFITASIYMYAKYHPDNFLHEEQYETCLIVEEANRVLSGEGGSEAGIQGQSIFEEMLDQAAGLGLFVFSITQKPSMMPSSILANSGLIWAGRMSIEDDIAVMMSILGKDAKLDDRSTRKFFSLTPTGWFMCKQSRTFDYKDSAPVMVAIDRLDVEKPTNEELKNMMYMHEIKKRNEEIRNNLNINFNNTGYYDNQEQQTQNNYYQEPYYPDANFNEPNRY